MSRKVLYHPDQVRALFNRMRGDLHDLHFKHMCQMADLRRQFDACRAELDELKSAVRARVRAEAELHALHRERDIRNAMRAERDPAAPLP